jgi:hypothetical protein
MPHHAVLDLLCIESCPQHQLLEVEQEQKQFGRFNKLLISIWPMRRLRRAPILVDLEKISATFNCDWSQKARDPKSKANFLPFLPTGVAFE